VQWRGTRGNGPPAGDCLDAPCLRPGYRRGREGAEGREPPLRPKKGLAVSDEGTGHRVGRSIASVGHTPRHKAVRTVQERAAAKDAALVCLDQRYTLSGGISEPSNGRYGEF